MNNGILMKLLLQIADNANNSGLIKLTYWQRKVNMKQ